MLSETLRVNETITVEIEGSLNSTDILVVKFIMAGMIIIPGDLKGLRTDFAISQVQTQFCCGNKLFSSTDFRVNYKQTLKSLLLHSTMACTAPVHRAGTQKRKDAT